MRTLKKIAFLLEEFALQTPAQQLLDRFLIGYPRDGAWRRIEGAQIVACVPAGVGEEELTRRGKDFGLVREADPAKALAGADAVVVVPRGAGEVANGPHVEFAVENLRAGCACFTHGVLAQDSKSAGHLSTRAAARGVPLAAGTCTPLLWRLPNVEVPADTSLKEALIVVQGPRAVAEMHGVEALLALVQRRRGGGGIVEMRALRGSETWEAGRTGKWSWSLLAAALSRSNSPQGDTLKDGRTQDLVGLGLVEKLAHSPRGLMLRHRDGLRSTVLVLDGVVADFNFAVQTREGAVISAQLYRPPPPSEHQFSRLAGVIEDFFRGGKPPWPLERSLMVAAVVARARESFQTA